MAQLLSLAPRARADLLAAPISAFESETQAVFEKTRPRFAHGILYAIAAMLVVSLALMSVVKLDRVVNAVGGW
jgi:hypothetical protein